MDFWTLKYVRTDLQKSSFWEEKYWISKMFKSEWGIETNRDRYCTLQSASQKRRTKHLPVSFYVREFEYVSIGFWAHVDQSVNE